ncbi:MAG: site-specific integrase [Patescibacteria group bacterium]|nr:site-specific integrase [Patescibacteria group bacterium]
MKRRGNNAGSVFWSTYFGRYVAEISLPNGKRRRLYGKKGDKSKPARLAVEERMARHVSPHGARNGSEKLGAFTDRIIETAQIRENTRDYYGWMAKHLGRLGSKKLVDIEPIDIRRHLDELEVGQRTRAGVYRLLFRVLREAADLGLIASNPAERVRAPKEPRREMRALLPHEVRYLLDAAKGDRLEALVILALTSTAGPAEMLALRRRDVHLNDGYILITHDLVTTAKSGYKPVLEPTKTAKRRRRIDLPRIAVDALRERLKRCLLENSGEYVFTNSEGRLIRLSVLRRHWWKALLKKAALLAAENGATFPTDLRLYDLRHTANALMGLAGISIEVARDRMGHESIQTTYDRYGHVYSARMTDAASRLDDLFANLTHELHLRENVATLDKQEKTR